MGLGPLWYRLYPLYNHVLLYDYRQRMFGAKLYSISWRNVRSGYQSETLLCLSAKMLLKSLNSVWETSASIKLNNITCDNQMAVKLYFINLRVRHVLSQYTSKVSAEKISANKLCKRTCFCILCWFYNGVLSMCIEISYHILSNFWRNITIYNNFFYISVFIVTWCY